MRNKFCDDSVLTNEAAVETFLISRILSDIGYIDDQIIPKTSIQELRVSLGSRSVRYKPDFALQVGGVVRWVLDAKAPDVRLDDYIGQCAGYCLMLNQGYRNENPVKYFVLTNGYVSRLYEWDSDVPILELAFTDFIDGNQKYQQFREIVSAQMMSMPQATVQEQQHILYKKSLDEVNTAFAWCHQHIYRKDAMSQAAAFEEFVKVVFLKLLSDRRVLRGHPEVLFHDVIRLPINELRFSTRWISEREVDTPNPVDTIQFRDLLNELEREIQMGTKKRIFDRDEHINLSPETIKGVVAKLEHIFLFGIDADLNGRLFETFLNATMRGKDLGQFFTPRSIIKLGTLLGKLQVGVIQPDGSRHSDVVMDACCGTGGFLIEALSNMWTKVDLNASLSDTEKKELKIKIATQHIYGVDMGREPAIARIARMNMYLHGDGGSSIFQADILDKQLHDALTDSAEIISEKAQLRSNVSLPNGFVDVVLTNPPFAKSYDRNTEVEALILDGYEIAFNEIGGRRIPRNSLKSSLLFIERYFTLLKPGGRMVTVIDDGILGGRDYQWVREYIRKKFIVKAVISLPGDAFQRSKARVKTSLLVLEKRQHQVNDNLSTEQPSIFMYACRYVGIDDPARQRTLPIDRENRRQAEKEIKIISHLFENFLQGDNSVQQYIVSGNSINDRMDVKSCLIKPGRNVAKWREAGFEVVKLSNFVDLVEFPEEDTIETKDHDDFVIYLRVRYDGYAEPGDEIVASDSTYSKLYVVHMGDIVISNIGATYGSCAIVPTELDGCVVTTEFTVIRAKEGIDPYMVWILLRSPEARANLLLLATGISRTRVRWENLVELELPIPPNRLVEEVVNNLSNADKLEREAANARKQAKVKLENELYLNDVEAVDILMAFKPPK
jgi:type I restriction enzyme M protein